MASRTVLNSKPSADSCVDNFVSKNHATWNPTWKYLVIYLYQITLLVLTTFSDQILQKKTAIRIVNGISAVQIVT